MPSQPTYYPPRYRSSGSAIVFLEDRVETLEAVCTDSKLEVCVSRRRFITSFVT